MSNQTNEDEQTHSQQNSVNPLEELRQCVANIEEGFYNYNHKTDTDPENHKFILENLKKFSQLWKSTDLSSDLRTEAQRHIVRLIGESPFTPVNFRTIRPSSVEQLPSEARRILLKEFQKLAQPSNFSYADDIIQLLEDPTNISKLHAAFCCLDNILHHVFVHKSLNAMLAKTFPRIELILPSLIQQLKAIAPPLKHSNKLTQKEPSTTEQEKSTSQENTNNNNISNNENNNNTQGPQDKLISKEGLMLGETIKTLLKVFGQGLSQVRISEKLWTVKSLESWLALCQFILTGINLSSTSYQSISSKIDFANPNLKNLSSLRNHTEEKTPYSVWWKCKKWSTFAFYHLVYRFEFFEHFLNFKIAHFENQRSPEEAHSELDQVCPYDHHAHSHSMNLELLSQLSTGKLPFIVVHWCFMYFHQLIFQMVPVSLLQVTTLLQNTLLPILGFSNMEYDLFTKNLPLYIRGVRDHDLPKIDQTDRIRHDIVSLIRALIQQYPNYIYPVLFDYIDNLFSKSAPGEIEKEVLRRKEGVLYLIQTTGRKILSVPQYCERIINCFKKHFIPEFEASCDLIRARVSVIFGVFMNSRRFQHQMGAEMIKLCCEKMVKALRDPNLFVTAKTAEALYLVICNVNYPSLWKKMLKEDFDRILDIFRETGDESIIDTAENLLGSGEEVAVECAPKICKRLVEDFLYFFEQEHTFLMRTRLPEAQGAVKPLEDETEPDWSSEYFLNPMQSLVDLCCDNPSTLNTVVDIILEKLFPVFSSAMQDNPEIFQDFATMLSVIAFHIQPFRPELWKYFDLLLDTTLQLEYEPEHFSPMIDFMYRDPKTFFENEHYVDKVWNLISGYSEALDFWEVGTILEQLLSSTTEFMNTRGLCKMQIRNLNKVCNNVVPKIVESALKSFKKAVPKNVFEVLLHCSMCCFASALPVFNTYSKSATLVFEFWFNCLNKIPPRMKRLNLFAMCGLFTVPSSQLPPIVQKNLQMLLEHIVHSLNDIELLKSEHNARWTEQKIHKKGITPRSPRKRADSRKPLGQPLTNENSNNSNNNNNNLLKLPEDNPSLERIEEGPLSPEAVFAKLGITLKTEKKTEREYSKLFPGEYGYDDEEEEMEDDEDEEAEDDAVDFVIGSGAEEEEPANVPPENLNEEEWCNEEAELGSDHSSDMAVGMYHNHDDTGSESYDSEEQESSADLHDTEDEEEEEEDEESDSEEDEEDHISSDEALELEEVKPERPEKKSQDQDESTVLDKIDEMVFVYDALHKVPANLDLIGLLSVDDFNMLKEYFEMAILRKAPSPLLDQCLHYVLSKLKRYEDQIKRLPEDILFKLQKSVITLRINLSDEEIQLLKFNQQQ